MTQDTRSGEKPLSTAYTTTERRSYDDGALGQHLEEAGLVLLKRLIEFLSECPPAPEESTMMGRRRSKSSSSSSTTSPQKKKRQRGLTLPASAIGWLSSQINNESSGRKNADAFDIGAYYPVPKQQIECLQMLFNRVTSLRISGEAWPPPHASASKTTSAAGDGVTAAAAANKGSLSSRIISKFSADQSVGEDSLVDDESCATTTTDVEVTVSPLQRYYHELQYKPNVDMSFFPNATKIVIDGIPPHWITNLDSLQKLEMFQMEKGCILDVNQLFFPSDLLSDSSSKTHKTKSEGLVRRDLSLIDEEGKMKEDSSLSGEGNKKGYTSLVVYSSLSKLRLSNCAMGETAGLRGRASSSSVPRVPTLSRFPNLTSLNLSRNELFKKKTVFAGLSSLPLLSSIDLSYNQLSRYVHWVSSHYPDFVVPTPTILSNHTPLHMYANYIPVWITSLCTSEMSLN